MYFGDSSFMLEMKIREVERRIRELQVELLYGIFGLLAVTITFYNYKNLKRSKLHSFALCFYIFDSTKTVPILMGNILFTLPFGEGAFMTTSKLLAIRFYCSFLHSRLLVFNYVLKQRLKISRNTAIAPWTLHFNQTSTVIRNI